MTDKERFIFEIIMLQKTSLLYTAVVGMVKINFSGGEPFMPEKGKYVGELVKFCKHELKLQSVTIVSNGSLIKEAWFNQYGMY